MADALAKYRKPQPVTEANSLSRYFAPVDDVAPMAEPSPYVVSAQPTGRMAAPETLAQIGRRGPNQAPIYMADIEHARAGTSHDVAQGGQSFWEVINALKAGWQKDRARIMASPEYKMLQESGMGWLIGNE